MTLVERITEHLSKLPPRSNDTDTAWLLREAQRELARVHDEIEMLRMAVRRYGDRSKMATVFPADLQLVIDTAFQNAGEST